MINLNNSNIILTGATGVIGKSILDKLISAGSNVLATGTNDQKLKNIKDKYKNLKVLKFDISDHKNIDQFVENCSSILSNKIDILFILSTKIHASINMYCFSCYIVRQI